MDPRTPAEIQLPERLDDPAVQDADPIETREWLDALASVIALSGSARAAYLLDRLVAAARPAVGVRTQWFRTPYVNTIALQMQPAYPGDLALEQRIVAAVRWNALAMVVRANQRPASWAATSRATPRRPSCSRSASCTTSTRPREGGRAIWCSSSRIRRPGVYARAFLEGRLSEADLAHYRREVQAPGPARGACRPIRTPG
jgi:pyruvate dehydrogenase E1 component